MLLEINEMIDHLDDFFSSNKKHQINVGGIAGTQINEYTIDAATKYTKFEKILFLDACQDFLDKKVDNHKFFYDIFDVVKVSRDDKEEKTWEADIMKRRPFEKIVLNANMVAEYDVIVVFNAELVYQTELADIVDNFPGKIIYVFDPIIAWHLNHSFYDTQMPVIFDTLQKVSPIIAHARSLIGFETRAIDKSIHCNVTEKSSYDMRSIGKIDNNQYVTNEYDIINKVRTRFYESGVKKNHRVIVPSSYMLAHHILDKDNKMTTITGGSLLTVESVTERPFMKLKLWNDPTNQNINIDVTYDAYMPYLKRDHIIRVMPANILTIDDFAFHKFDNVVAIIGTNSDMHNHINTNMYAILKNSKNVTIIKTNK